MKVYMAGPIAGKSYNQAVFWYAQLEEAIEYTDLIQLVAPMRAKSFLSLEEKLSDVYNGPLTSSKGITTRDRWDVMRCDIVCANLTDDSSVSIGTMIELGWADAFRKPVIAILNRENRYDKHGMIADIVGFKVFSIDEAGALLVSLL